MAGEICDHDRTADLVRSYENMVCDDDNAVLDTRSAVLDHHGSGSSGTPRRPR